ncbi:myoD family inhibitor domain-containing protein 2 isoform X1 [Pimephales promelas]|uniref:myoD family inhibitor domain-containing protein 2 isoform X1 n=2 Tax=Pogonichthyinae TaxID=2743731 RepID=UPI001955D6EC|nr:myoD family inhibitor domain-containing protein 2 isoform X1 [Pimephales promelas]
MIYIVFTKIISMMAGQNSEIELDLIKTEERSSFVKAGAEVSSKATGRLSPIPELDPWEREADTDSTEFTYSLCSVDRYSTAGSSSSSLSDSQERGELCAGIVLNCLFCRFYDLFLMLPETCERAAISICPTYMLFSPPAEPAHTNWNCSCDFDCGLRDICHETGECLELAMEISEVCYR